MKYMIKGKVEILARYSIIYMHATVLLIKIHIFLDFRFQARIIFFIVLLSVYICDAICD